MDLLLQYCGCPNWQNDFEALFEAGLKGCDFREAVETVCMLWGERYGRHVKRKNCHAVHVNPIEKGGKINEAHFQTADVDVSINRVKIP